MKKTLTLIILLFVTIGSAFAQTRFVKAGIVEYDRSVNMFAILNRQYAGDNDNVFGEKMVESYKKTHSQIKILKSKLKFSDNKTLFVPIEGEPNDYYFDAPMAEQVNTTYTDFGASAKLSQKKVFEDQFLVKDSTTKIKWKITGETREILGYTCRRANGLILDSVYVVAFYTDQITTPGGPESFSGLPGMILQVALPHENVSWLATKVTDTTLPENEIAPPKKGKPVTAVEFKDKLKSVMKNWGKYANVYLMALNL